MVLRMYEIPGSHVDISVHGSSDKVLAFPGPVESTRAVARVLGHLLTYIINLASAEQKKKRLMGSAVFDEKSICVVLECQGSKYEKMKSRSRRRRSHSMGKWIK